MYRSPPGCVKRDQDQDHADPRDIEGSRSPESYTFHGDTAGARASALGQRDGRAIDLREGEAIDAAAFKAVAREAVVFNGAKVRR